jgi:hypothetical protein
MPTAQEMELEINGVFDTQQTVISNLETLCTAASSWLNFDVNSGLWSVVINQAGTSTASFNNTNIIGNINISGTGITELYNSVRVSFPHRDLNDQGDIITLSTPAGDRFSNEQENTLEINFDVINDPIRAEMIGLTELKQSRVDKIIEFRTDFSKMGVKAGDLIDVTAEMYGFTNKVFRVIRISEEDADDNSIQISITALEYDADVYDYTDLEFYPVTRENGVVSKNVNPTILNSDYVSTSNSVSRSISGSDSSNVSAVNNLTASLVLNTPIPGLLLGGLFINKNTIDNAYNTTGSLVYEVTVAHANPVINAEDPQTPFKLIQFVIDLPNGGLSFTKSSTQINLDEQYFPTVVGIFYNDTAIPNYETYNWETNPNGYQLIFLGNTGLTTPNYITNAIGASPGYWYIYFDNQSIIDLSLGAVEFYNFSAREIPGTALPGQPGTGLSASINIIGYE